MQKKSDAVTLKSKKFINCLSSCDSISAWIPNILVFIAYIFLTIVFTYPVFFSKMVPGEADVHFYLWDLWWFKKSFMDLSSPYFTPYLFYPNGVNLAFSAITPFNGILSVPLQFIFGLTRTYTILWLLSFIISGYGTFLLVRYLSKNSKAAFVSGLIFMFSPYHFAHSLGHLNLLSIEWIPFYVLFFFKTIKEDNFKNSIYAAFFLLLVFLSEYTYAVYLCIFTAFFLLYYIFEDRNYIVNKNVIIKLFLMALSFSILVLPFAYPLLKELLLSKSSYMYSAGFVTYSADLLAFFVPSKFHPIFGQFVLPIYQNFTGNVAEFTVFAGYTVLILSMIAILRIRTKEVKFWALSTLVFFIFALGPLLHVNGLFTGTIENINFAVPLPYAIIMKIPIISIARVPSRWDAIVMLNLSVLAGYGLSYLYNRLEKRSFWDISASNYLMIVFAALILFEFLAVPYPVANMEIPEFYNSLSEDPEDYAIFEVPNIGYLAFPEYMYYQTLHEKKILTGYTHIPESSMKFVINTPYINLFFTSGDYDKYLNVSRDIFNQNITEVGPSILNYYNIKYIILHENLMSKEELSFIQKLLDNSLSTDPTYYKNDSMIVYEIMPSEETSFFIPGDGWYGLEYFNGVPSRWMSSNATLIIFSEKNYSSVLRFDAMSFNCSRTLNIAVDSSGVSGIKVPSRLITAEIPLELHKGENFVQFKVIGASERPCDIPWLNSADDRELSIAIQNITITNKTFRE
ncbi:hypothetical protein [uncultured Methanomethylovorans sp.]|uniref:hypothetical protein n=1 Tax=uncultured Methanomethylovorans sp. TaxID=183759 RepID=UPI002614A253|nr:hypothetical protein [uncultured Methanomethylovorans sp.]